MCLLSDIRRSRRVLTPLDNVDHASPEHQKSGFVLAGESLFINTIAYIFNV